MNKFHAQLDQLKYDSITAALTIHSISEWRSAVTQLAGSKGASSRLPAGGVIVLYL